MIALSTLARLVRRGPTLLLAQAPEEHRLLRTVRLFAPSAHIAEPGVIEAGDGALRGPIPVTATLAWQTDVPRGWPVAYLAEAEHTLVKGLAHRLGGLTFEEGRPAPRPESDHHRVTVHLPRRPDPAELIELISPLSGGVTHTDAPGMDLYSGGQVSALVRRTRGARPHAVQGLDDLNLTCDLSENPTDGEFTLRLGETALLIAAQFGGVVVDCDGFRLTTAEDLLPGLTSPTVPSRRRYRHEWQPRQN